MKEPPNGLKFQVGMKLEAIDPLNLSAICVATVMKVFCLVYWICNPLITDNICEEASHGIFFLITLKKHLC